MTVLRIGDHHGLSNLHRPVGGHRGPMRAETPRTVAQCWEPDEEKGRSTCMGLAPDMW